ncbi:hypothetical protein [Streptomyces microflavus]|uniref:hypothetical protein n=1 Tax=Streptomyces microflavus TaxID=1919 RepID=UPI0033F66F18
MQLDRCLSGDAEPEGPEISGLVMAATALSCNGRAISESARSRAFDAMMREADRQARPQSSTEHAEDLTDPGIHSRNAKAGPGLRIAVADIENIDDDRIEAVAQSLAARFSQNAPDRNP